jgi:hypothetical protein
MPLTGAEYSKRWREKHPDKVVEVRVKFYNNNKEKESIRQHKKYLWKKECERLRNILF